MGDEVVTRNSFVEDEGFIYYLKYKQPQKGDGVISGYSVIKDVFTHF